MQVDALPGVSVGRQKLIKAGNCHAVVIPVQFIRFLGWMVGDFIAVEVLEDRTLRLRPLEQRDWQRPAIPRLAPPPQTADTK